MTSLFRILWQVARSIRTIALLVLVGGFSSVVTAQDPLMGTASVIDGDTIEIHGQLIRLHGIDAPESSQLCRHQGGKPWRCGQQAALALSDTIGRSSIRCVPRDRDRYGRIVAVCFKGDEDLNRWMVANGWAVAYRKYSLEYLTDEDRARVEQRNIWSGSFDMPWDLRAGNRK
jgi:endonuclease YncB( thermonuclease family)